MDIVYLNGDYMPSNEAKVSVFDRGFVLGDGIYEVLPVIDGKLVDVEGFWERFERSLGQIELDFKPSKEEFVGVLSELVRKNELKEGGVYTQVTRGVAKREFWFLENLEPTCMAFCFEKPIVNNPKAKTGFKVFSVEDIRWKRRDIKSISLLAQCKAKNDAHKQGGDEGFMVENGFVSEGVSSTAYIVKNGRLITTPLTNQILPGVRRKNIVKIADKLGLKMEFRHFSIEEVKSADECFVSSATLLVMPVVECDGVQIAGGKVGQITQKIRDEYIKKIYEEIT